MFEAVFARGTNPIHYYETPYKAEDIVKISVTYRQNGKNIVKKTLEDCLMEENRIEVQLTQQETMQFVEGEALAQVKIRTKDGEILRSLDHRIQILGIFDEEEF